MKKSPKSRRAKRKSHATSQASAGWTKRDVLRLFRNGAVGLAAVGGVGYFGTRSVLATIAEHDLTRIGQGKPTIVQIHDPQCPTCLSLQKATRRALRCFGECDFVYLVANIKTDEGGALANRHGVPHVTLLVFDAEGELTETIHGLRTRDELKDIFQGHTQAA